MNKRLFHYRGRFAEINFRLGSGINHRCARAPGDTQISVGDRYKCILRNPMACG